MNTRISTDYKGMTTEAVNVEIHNQVIKTVVPKRNAVIIDFITTKDDSGREVVSTITTIECLDDDLYEEMKEYAIKINRN